MLIILGNSKIPMEIPTNHIAIQTYGTWIENSHGYKKVRVEDWNRKQATKMRRLRWKTWTKNKHKK